MVKKYSFMIFMLLLLLAGCNPGMYEMLTRTQEDPFVINPYVLSFVESYTIITQWDEDPAADEYLLERARDVQGTLFFETIYKGTDTMFKDLDVKEDERCIYRLSKRRGKEWFGPSEGAMGVGSHITRNTQVNDTMERAFKLESRDYIANMFYYRTYNGLELTSEAWFYIDIPAFRQASIVVNDKTMNEITGPTHFEFYVYERNIGIVFQQSEFTIINEDLETHRFYFKLYPAKNRFLNSITPAGGYLVEYRINLKSILPIFTGGG